MSCKSWSVSSLYKSWSVSSLYKFIHIGVCKVSILKARKQSQYYMFMGRCIWYNFMCTPVSSINKMKVALNTIINLLFSYVQNEHQDSSRTKSYIHLLFTGLSLYFQKFLSINHCVCSFGFTEFFYPDPVLIWPRLVSWR